MAEADPQIEEQSAVAADAPRKRRWGRLALMVSLPLALLVGGLI